MALRRFANVAPAVAMSRAFTPAAVTAGIPALPHVFSEDVITEIRRMGSTMDKMVILFDSRLDRMESKMDRMESKMDRMETRIRALYEGGWFRSNENTIYASIAVGFIVVGVVVTLRDQEQEARMREQKVRHLVELQAIIAAGGHQPSVQCPHVAF